MPNGICIAMPLGRTEVDRVMADLKYRLVKKLDEEALERGLRSLW